MLTIRPLHFGDIISVAPREHYINHTTPDSEQGFYPNEIRLAFPEEDDFKTRYFVLEADGVQAGIICTKDDAGIDKTPVIIPRDTSQQASLWQKFSGYINSRPQLAKKWQVATLTLPANPEQFEVREVDESGFESAMKPASGKKAPKR